MAITKINNPPFIQRQDSKGWEKFDTGKRSWGLFKGYDGDTISAADLGLKTIHGALVSSQRHGVRAGGSVVLRGSKSNNVTLSFGSKGAGSAYGTFVHFYVDAWGY